MKLLDKVKVGGHWYNVVFPYTFKERIDLDGHTDNDILEIKISQGDCAGQKLAEGKIEELFLHELLHIVDDVYNASALDEPTVKRLGQGLYQVLKDNFNLKLQE